MTNDQMIDRFVRLYVEARDRDRARAVLADMIKTVALKSELATLKKAHGMP